MDNTSPLPAINPVSGFFLAAITAAIVLTLLILILPSDLFLALSNYLQILVALSGALVLLCSWHRTGSRQPVLLYAGAGFGIWGIANIAWYIVTFMGFRNLVFPSVIDLGLILGLLLLAVALWTGQQREKPSPVIITAIVLLSLCVLAAMLLVAGAGLTAALATFVYFVSCGFLIAGGLEFRQGSFLPLVTGVFFLGIAHMIYPIREIYLVANPVFSVVGTIICIGFALVLLGLLPLSEPAANA